MPQEYKVIAGVVIAVIVFLAAGFFIVTLVLFNNYRKKKHSEEKQSMQFKFHQELLQTQLEIQEQTFQNISQEIHDNIGQTLSFIKLTINTIDINQRDIAKDKLAESKTLLTKAIQELRDLSRMLNTDFINEIGLANAIERQLNILQKTGIYTTAIKVTGEPEKYHLQRELVIFRVVQELLNNVVKHAEASCVTITINYQPQQLMITLIDDGKGFDTSKESDGIGINNMFNRIQLIQGSISIISKPEESTQAIIQLPKYPSTTNGNV